MKVKEVYNILLKNGELLDMYPMLSGSWVEDEDDFTGLWADNIGLIDNNGEYEEY